MAEYIELEKAIKALCDCVAHTCYLGDCDKECQEVRAIISIHVADVRPVVRGKWIERRLSENVYGAECSVCHTTWDTFTSFCPFCGADMRES